MGPRTRRQATTGRPRLVLASRGDALTPYLFAALERRYPVAGRLNPELTAAQRYSIAATTFRPDRSAWAERFYKSGLAFRVRTRNALRQLAEVRAPYDAVVQVHALFDVPGAPSMLYIDCTHRQSAEQWPDWNPMTGAQLDQWYRREREAYHRATHLFSFSEETRDSLIHHYGVPAERVTVTGAGTNVEALPEIAPGPREPVILFVGNDWVRKGGRVLLQAFAQVRARVPGAQLVLVGTPPPETIDQPGVQVLGRVHDRAEIARLYSRAAVFAMPSFFDPFPLVVIEAMGFGVPVVASRSCGIPEIVVDGGTGLLVDAGSVDELADELTTLLRDPDRARAMGLAGRARVEQHFGWDDVVDRMDAALQASWTS